MADQLLRGRIPEDGAKFFTPLVEDGKLTIINTEESEGNEVEKQSKPKRSKIRKTGKRAGGDCSGSP